MNKKITWPVTGLLALPFAVVAHADLANPAAAKPALPYQSAFADYKPWQDLQPGNWRAINDALAALPSGHGAHGAAPAAPAEATPGLEPAKAAPGQPPGARHDAHHMQGPRK